MNIKWDEAKNDLLKKTRQVSFEQVIEEIKKGNFIGPEDNPARKSQKRIIVKLDGYPCVVPIVVEDEETWVFKTIYPCRKMKGRI
ncbi:MAG: hypothetical protein IJR49_01520 [Treponema sp.]|nr:hypothetical protein [Treponema sp.]